jgi:hypothetical protein
MDGNEEIIQVHSILLTEVVLLFIRSNMLKLYRFYKRFGRMGELEGVFAAHEHEVKQLIGQGLDFGEALGKHSEICFTLQKGDVKVVSEDQDFIKQFVKILPNGAGVNPFDGLEEE